jgi:hypothetical protein
MNRLFTVQTAEKENGELEEQETDQLLRNELDDLNVKNFLQIISRIDEDVHSFVEFVDISELNPPDPGNSREKPDLKKHYGVQLCFNFLPWLKLLKCQFLINNIAFVPFMDIYHKTLTIELKMCPRDRYVYDYNA